ncbi:MAG: GNAT family N-acetyltransferase [Saprospiraceae bacterium]|nr:GNAT family N-acetyltransferase [Saprospiraceae bacterium]
MKVDVAPMFFKLDNPAWHSLNEVHKSFNVGNEVIRLYQPDVCPFGGIQPSSPEVMSQLDDLIRPDSTFFILGELPPLPEGYDMIHELLCVQMVCMQSITMPNRESLVYLNDNFREELVRLVQLVQPGYFQEKTCDMGDYFGIFQDGKLVAAAGERMRMNRFTEVSAVVTLPDFGGRGYAKQLVAHVVNKNLSAGNIPYLHVAEHNLSAIGLYEKLGFIKRRTIPLRKIRRAGPSFS